MSRARFYKHVFGNGLTLLTERHSGFRGLTIGIWVKVGTRHERTAEAGASHFLEHMLFKGTATRSALDIAREVDRVGGEFNAFTAREHTCFHITLLSRDVGLAADILADIVLNSSFDPEELERERRVILQEIAMVEENPEELAHDIYFELIYGTHGLGKPILGTATSIRRMGKTELVRFFRENYRPDQLIVAVAGDVSHEALKRKLGALIRSRWPGRPTKARGSSRHVPAPTIKPGLWWIERRTEQAHLVWGVQGPTYAWKDRFAAFLLNTYLGGGMSSSLFQEIREKNGLAYTVYSNISSFVDSGVFSIYAATGVNRVPLCLRLIDECCERMKRELMSKDDLEAMKQNFMGTFLLAQDNMEARMGGIARNEIYLGKYFSADEVARMVDSVTPDDVRRVARQILRGEKSALVMGPKPSREIATRLRPSVPRRYCRT